MDFDSLPDDSAIPAVIRQVQSQATQPVPTPVSALPAPTQDGLNFDNMVDDSQKQAGSPTDLDFDSLQDDSEKYGTTAQQIGAGAEGFARGLVGPLAPAAERALNIATPQEMRGRQEANPWTSALGEAAGFGTGMVAGTGEAAIVGKFGEAAQALSGLEGTGGIASKIAAGAVRAGTEMAAYQSLDEASKAIMQDPNQTMGSVASNIGLSSMIGVATGGALSGIGGAVGKLADSNFLKEFKDRLSLRASTANPNEAMEKEFNDALQTYHSMNDEVLGPQGLKAQALSKLLPQTLTPAIQDQIQDIANKGQAAMADMIKKDVPPRYITKLMNDLNAFQEVATNPNASVGQNFDALNNLKQTLQGYSKGNFGPFSIPSYHEAYDFLNVTKSLGHDIREGLEDPKVWGDAANLQKDLNASWSKVLPAVKDVQSKFMEKIGGQPVPSTQKFGTYTNQNGKATSQTIRQKMMGNFVDGMQNHFDTVDKIYQDAGVANPHPPVGLGQLKESLGKTSTASKLADMWYDKIGPDAIATTVGAAAGSHLVPGLGGFGGAYVGKHLLGPAFGAVVKPILDNTVNTAAFKNAYALTQSIVKGDSELANAAANLFIGGAKTIPSNLMPTPKELDKLGEQVKDLKQNQNNLFNAQNQVTHYLPEHGQAMAKTVGNSINYLGNLQPQPIKNRPLDQEIEPSKEQKQAFNRILSVAQQPLMALHYIKEGTLVPNDVGTLKALYPEYYSKMSQQLMSSLSDHVSSGKTVPYKLRQGLSMFLGEPLDSTMTQPNIMAIQNVFAQQQAASQAAASPVKTKKGTAPLSKAADIHMTADQARSQRQAKV